MKHDNKEKEEEMTWKDVLIEFLLHLIGTSIVVAGSVYLFNLF